MSRDLNADAEECKTKGNDCLAQKDFDTAIKWYTQALDFAKHLPTGSNNRHVYYSNRSAAYLSKEFADSALKDAEACILEKPDWPKGYGRKGAALHFQKKFPEAMAAYEAGLAVVPGDASLLKGLQEVKADSVAPPRYSPRGGAGGGGSDTDMMKQLSQVFSDPNAKSILRSNPKTSAFMNDPSFVRTIDSLQANPLLIGQLMQTDKRILTALTVLMGIPGTTGFDEDNEMDEETRIQQEKTKKAKQAEEDRIRAEEKLKQERASETPEARAQREASEQAMAAKERGNALYKKREFEQAVMEYKQAIDLCPTDMTFYLNIASVLAEQKKVEESLEACNKAIEVGRAHGAKYEQLAKAFDRRGNILAKQGKMEEALLEYQKAQLENRTSEVDQKMDKLKKAIKLAAEKDYVNPELGRAANQKGNELLASGLFPEATREFTEAISRDPNNAQYFVDRSLAYTKLMDFGRAQEDVDKAIALDPNNVSAYSRRGKIETFTKRLNRALDSYRKGLELEPGNKECQEGLRNVEELIRKQSQTKASTNSRGEADEEEQIRNQRAMADPEIRSILADPVMQQVLRDLSSDPKASQHHLRNPGIAAKIEKLIAAGVVRTG